MANIFRSQGADACCGKQVDPPGAAASAAGHCHWVAGHVETPAGLVPGVTTRWTWREHLGAMKARWNIGRMHYAVAPGLYAVGQPDQDAILVATANYKLSFDLLRRALHGLKAWILVLDTKGINVWCAAGKGTFGTEELIHRLSVTNVARALGQSTLILPQLGAPGVAAHEVTRRTGFRVVYGPVRASELPAFLRAGRRATPAMRRVTFTLRDRLAVVPVELVQRCAPALLIMLLFILAAGWSRHGYHVTTAPWRGIAVAVWSGLLAGVVMTPALLPWLPGRAFAVKGGTTGLLTGLALWWCGGYGRVEGLAVALLCVAACSYLGLMFTGCTPYTSASGVRREIAWAIPLQIATSGAGLLLWGLARFI
ncbi:MAG: mercury methylation corrinoid protein HgcA [Kiritimatiellaeota bacterium]|nr:mercury methylation corrinoid protein HgcA [Kiritimatiellota bacterium]